MGKECSHFVGCGRVSPSSNEKYFYGMYMAQEISQKGRWSRMFVMIVNQISCVWRRLRQQALRAHSLTPSIIITTWKNARGASRGIAIGISEEEFEVLDTLIGTFCLIVIIKRRLDGWIQTVLMVYGLNRTYQRNELWKELEKIRDYSNNPWIIRGF